VNSNNEEGYDDDMYEDGPYILDIDTEAVAWAYNKLLAYNVGNTTMDNALMLDRLNLMLLGN
jgi:hypothetical protein